MERPDVFLQLSSIMANEWTLVVGIVLAIIIALIPAIIALLRVERRSDATSYIQMQNHKVLFTIYRDGNGELKVQKH